MHVPLRDAVSAEPCVHSGPGSQQVQGIKSSPLPARCRVNIPSNDRRLLLSSLALPPVI